MINILIPEETPSLNKGEAAILCGMLETFAQLGSNYKVTVFSVNYAEDKQRYKNMADVLDARGIMPTDIITMAKSPVGKVLEIFFSFCRHLLFFVLYVPLGKSATKVMKRDIWEAYSDADVVIICHDSLYSPAYHPLVTLFCKLLRKKIVIYGATFNPTIRKKDFPSWKKYLSILSMKMVLNRADLITLREGYSHDFLREIGFKGQIHHTGDLPILLRAAPDSRAREIIEKEGIDHSRPIIGMTIGRHQMGPIFIDVRDVKIKYEKLISVIRQVVDFMIEEYGATVVFIPHCIGRGKILDDRIVADDIAAGVKNSERVRVIHTEYGPEDLKAVVGIFDLFVGHRLHSVVDAVTMHVPSIMMSHSNDFRAHGIVGETLGQSEWIYNLENLQAAALCAKIDELWKQRKKVRKGLVESVKLAREQTMQNGYLLASLLRNRL